MASTRERKKKRKKERERKWEREREKHRGSRGFSLDNAEGLVCFLLFFFPKNGQSSSSVLHNAAQRGHPTREGWGVLGVRRFQWKGVQEVQRSAACLLAWTACSTRLTDGEGKKNKKGKKSLDKVN